MFTLRNRGQLNQVTEDEFENLITSLRALWLEEHNDDGTHQGLDAAAIASGVLDKARQHAETAYKDEANTFTQAQTITHETGSFIRFDDTTDGQAGHIGVGQHLITGAAIDTLGIRSAAGLAFSGDGSSLGMSLSNLNALSVSNAQTTPLAMTSSHATLVRMPITASGTGAVANDIQLVSNALSLFFGINPSGAEGTAYWDNRLGGTRRFVFRNNGVEKVAIDAAGRIFERSLSTAMGDWAPYTPTLTNVTIGNGQVTAKFSRVGKTVSFSIMLIFGSTTSVTGHISMTTPTAHTAAAAVQSIGTLEMFDNSSGLHYAGRTRISASPGFSLYTNASPLGAVTGTAPFTWATSDQLFVSGTYEEP